MSTSGSSLGGPVIRVLGFHCHRLGFSLRLGNQILKASGTVTHLPQKISIINDSLPKKEETVSD